MSDEIRYLPSWMVSESTDTRHLPSWMESESYFTNREQKTKEYIQFKGLIKSCVFANILASFAEEILVKIESSKMSEVVFGFDMEWPVSYVGQPKKTALVQICTDHSTCYLFHVFYIVKLPSIFVHLINHPRVKWSGVCIKNDFIKLGRDFKIDVSSALNHIIDLGTYTNKVLNFESSFRWSMAKLVQHLLKKNVNKDNNIRMGHWENTNLDEDQCMYAATDAYISLLLYEHLRKLDTEKNEI